MKRNIAVRLLLFPLLLCAVFGVFLIDVWDAGVKEALWNIGHNLYDAARWVATGKEFCE